MSGEVDIDLQDEQVRVVGAGTSSGEQEWLLSSEASIHEGEEYAEIETALVWKGNVILNSSSTVSWCGGILPVFSR